MVRLDLGADDGIVLRDVVDYLEPGGLVVRARFAEGMQTTASLDRRAVTFTIGPAEPVDSSFEASRSLDQPYDAGSLFRLTTLRGDLIAYPYGFLGAVRRWQPATASWVDHEHPGFARSTHSLIRNVQTVDNRLLAFYEDAVIYGEQVLDVSALGVSQLRILSIGEYTAGVMTISVVSGPDAALRAGLVRCNWRPGDAALHTCAHVEMPPSAIAPSNLDRLAFGWHHHRSGALLAYTLNGYLGAFDGTRWIDADTTALGTAWQGYSTTEHAGQVLLGLYPQGSVTTVHADTTTPGRFVATLPSESIGAAINVRRDEAQSLLSFGEEVLAGVWPWGEVFRGTPDRGWSVLVRLFSQSSQAPGPGHPYEERIGGSNCLGQRVFQIVPWAGGVAMATTMKNMDPECAGMIAALGPGEAAEYGRVHFLARTNAITCDVPWVHTTMELMFTISRDQRMQVVQNGRLLCDAPYVGRLPSGQPNPMALAR